MTFRILIGTGLTCLLAAGTALGQGSPAAANVNVAIGYQGLPSKGGQSEVGGVQLSESALLHVGVGAEAGYDSNVFYAETSPRGSAIARIVPFLELTNAARNGAVNSDLYYDLGAALVYREYLSSDPDIKSQRAFMPSAYGNLEFSKMQSLSFGLSEAYTRTEDPPYQVSQAQITRDVNQASASLRWTPGGGRLGMVLRYTNTVDAFETNNLRFANSMGHLLLLDTSWKWLPKTALVLQVSQGYISYFHTDATGVTKPASFPFHAYGGIRGLITPKLTVNLAVGYGNGFYDLTNRSGPSGYGSISATADVVYQPTLLTSVQFGYRRDFLNAIIGDFYYLDAVYLNIGQAIAGRVGFGLSARYESRSFENVPVRLTATAPTIFRSRHDNFFQLGANLDYRIRDWIYAGVAYTMLDNSAGSETLGTLDSGRVSYVKHLVFARLGVTY
jgi:hypothetical protein